MPLLLGPLPQRGVRVVDQFLPARLRPRAAALRAGLETARQPAPGVRPETLADLAEAIGRREVVAFDYADRHGTASRRRVEPHRQAHLRQRWYLLGWDRDRAGRRVFRLDRVTGLVRTGMRHPGRALPADTALAYLRQGMHADRVRVRLDVRAEPHRVADALRHHDAEIRCAGDGRTRVTLWLDAWQWLVAGLAFLDADVTIVEPEEFRRACAAFARRLLAATGHTDPPGRSQPGAAPKMPRRNVPGSPGRSARPRPISGSGGSRA